MTPLRRLVAFTDRDPSRATMVARGVVLLATVALVTAVLGFVGGGGLADRVRVTASFDDVGGALVPGGDVKLRGVIVGSVGRIAAAGTPGGGIEVDLVLRPEHAERMPGDLVARVLPATVFGTTYVELMPGASGEAARGTLRNGQRIPQDTSRETLELQTILDGLDNVVTALGPAELAAALDGLAGALDGNGERLGRTMDQVVDLLGRLNPRMPLVRENLDLLATNLEVLRSYGDDLFDAVDDLSVVSATLVGQEGQLTELLSGSTRLFAALSRLVEENDRALVDALFQTAISVETLFEGRTQLPRGLVGTFDFVRAFSGAMDEGPYLKLRSILRGPAARRYTDADCPSYGEARGRGCGGGR